MSPRSASWAPKGIERSREGQCGGQAASCGMHAPAAAIEVAMESGHERAMRIVTSMKTNFLRAAAASFLLGSAGVTAAAIMIPQGAEAAGVRPAVGTPLNEAISLANSGHGSEALAKVHQAESVGGLSASEQQSIAKGKDFPRAKAGPGSGPTACRAKFSNDYNASRYRDAIADADCLRKNGTFSGQDQLIVAQAYYLMGDYAGTIRAARGLGGAQAQELMLSAAYKSGDLDTQRTILEQLVRDGKS